MLRQLRVRRVLSVLRAELEEHFSFLRAFGYGPPTFETDHDGVLGPGVIALFHSPARLLRVYVSACSKGGPDDRHVMVAHLARREPSVENGERDSLLSLDWYADLHRRDLAGALDALADRRSTVPRFIRDALPIYATLLQDDARAIVAGTRWEAGDGIPRVARAFDFLVSELGFSLPVGGHVGHDVAHRYRRGDVTVGVTWDGAPHYLISIEIAGELKRWLQDVPLDEAAAVIKAHPEILSGDFRALDARWPPPQAPARRASARPRQRRRG